MRGLNYNHLHYFWTVAKEGSIVRASEVLHLTPQTISGQLRLLEEALGGKLFARTGRKLVLTDIGRLAFSYADDIFRLGAEMEDVLQGRVGGQPLEFAVGIVDVVPKLVAYRLLEPALKLSEPVRIVCREGKLDALLTDIAVHRLDMLLADTPISPSANVRVFNHLLGECGVSFFAARDLAEPYQAGFPGSLSGAPMLLPATNTALRGALMQWLDQQGVRPRIVGEFEDSALMTAFGQAGVGVFIAPSVIEADLLRTGELAVIGRSERVRERFYAISAERRLRHPAVVAVSQAARAALFTVADTA
ncbi:transcriptional activator NhaR [Thermithiobacillus plumbiphilus]|uniref:Transcriptional activator NhaR n=1 Tax=Thermithiobacillus plumbiphilus TaxID=1729899 RepID=A0ABU9DBC1_9PROT